MGSEVLWLVPLAYGVHMLEETPRFVAWTRRYQWLFTSTFDIRRFWLGNAVFTLYVVLAVALAQAVNDPLALVIGSSTAGWILANFLVHALTTVSSGVYSPGVVTAGAIYVPTALYVYGSLLDRGALTPELAAWSVLIGFAAMYLPFLNSIRMARAERRTQVVRP